MPLKLLLDENLRDRRIWSALHTHNSQGSDAVDVVRVGDEGGPELGIGDDELIAWAASQQRILIAQDRSTLPRHLAKFCSDGNDSPGVVFPRHDLSATEFVELLVLIAYTSSAEEWANTYRWIP